MHTNWNNALIPANMELRRQSRGASTRSTSSTLQLKLLSFLGLSTAETLNLTIKKHWHLMLCHMTCRWCCNCSLMQTKCCCYLYHDLGSSNYMLCPTGLLLCCRMGSWMPQNLPDRECLCLCRCRCKRCSKHSWFARVQIMARCNCF